VRVSVCVSVWVSECVCVCVCVCVGGWVWVWVLMWLWACVCERVRDGPASWRRSSALIAYVANHARPANRHLMLEEPPRMLNAFLSFLCTTLWFPNPPVMQRRDLSYHWEKAKCIGLANTTAARQEDR